jgi:hypothetical protein
MRAIPNASHPLVCVAGRLTTYRGFRGGFDEVQKGPNYAEAVVRTENRDQRRGLLDLRHKLNQADAAGADRVGGPPALERPWVANQ